jgi:hypothetical protein
VRCATRRTSRCTLPRRQAAILPGAPHALARCRVVALAVLIVTRFADAAHAQEPPQRANDEAVAKLLKTQLQAAQKSHRAAVKTMEVKNLGGGVLVQVMGNTDARPDLVYLWSVRWLSAQRDLAETREARLTAYVDHQKRITALNAQVKLVANADPNLEGGILRNSAIAEAEWYLAEADLWLLKERAK